MDDERVLDGNVLAGDLGAVFTAEMTSATVTCAGCGDAGALAQAVAYVDAPGTVLRCRGCEGVLARVVRTRDEVWLELRGIRSIRVPAPTVGASPA
ncbi:DUF6510 family protein [Nocardioides marinquilinus]|uniref:DUF6510 family protein n=1 Tax=Nocardioides marinquilinus TaxID=1210400 RepID=A0ABP9PY53_9ACTN